jgi:hypothetical protein
LRARSASLPSATPTPQRAARLVRSVANTPTAVVAHAELPIDAVAATATAAMSAIATPRVSAAPSPAPKVPASPPSPPARPVLPPTAAPVPARAPRASPVSRRRLPARMVLSAALDSVPIPPAAFRTISRVRRRHNAAPEIASSESANPLRPRRPRQRVGLMTVHVPSGPTAATNVVTSVSVRQSRSTRHRSVLRQVNREASPSSDSHATRRVPQREIPRPVIRIYTSCIHHPPARWEDGGWFCRDESILP